MTTPSAASRPPKHLGAAGRAAWRAICDAVDLERYELVPVRLLCEALDRAEQARLILETDGLTVPTAHGVKTHPAVAIERDSRAAAAQFWRVLGLHDVDDSDAGTPQHFTDSLRAKARRGHG